MNEEARTAQAEMQRTYVALKDALNKLRSQLVSHDAQRPAIVFATAGRTVEEIELPSFRDEEARERTATAIEKISADREAPITATLRLPGLIAAGPETLAAVLAVNTAKAAFKTAVLAVSAHKREPMLRAITGRGIHLQQAYRAIPMLRRKPARVSFVWAVGLTENIRVTKENVLKYLAEKEAPGEDQALITQYPDETRFVRRQRVAAHPRANILWADATGSMAHAYLPFFYPDDGAGLPEYIPLQIARKRVRAARTDRKARIPILPSWGVYLDDR